jgi:hypothetical protein
LGDVSWGRHIRRSGQGLGILQPLGFDRRRAVLHPRRLGRFETSDARAQRGIFLFQGVEPRRYLLIERGRRCRMSDRGGGQCETEKQSEFCEPDHGLPPRRHPIGELHTRLVRPVSNHEITPSRAERRENPKRCSGYWVLTTREIQTMRRVTSGYP